MKIAIIDDKQEIRDSLNTGLRGLQPDKVKTELFGCGEEIIKRYEKGNAGFDVIFLDIEMEGMDGIETANRIRSLDRHVLIVFVTNYTKYMQRSFECMPFRFLVKPVETEMLEKTYREICIKLADRPGTFVFTENKQHIRVFCEDILFFESRGHWIVLHKKDGKTHKIRKTMNELLGAVEQGQFGRIHRSFVVNFAAIYKIEESGVMLYNYDVPLPLSRSYKKEFIGAFLNFEERRFVL